MNRKAICESCGKEKWVNHFGLCEECCKEYTRIEKEYIPTIAFNPYNGNIEGKNPK